MATNLKRRLVRRIKPLVEKFPRVSALYRDLRDALPARFGEPTMTSWGFRLVGLESMRSGEFEPDEMRFVESQLDATDVFVDVGANIGYFGCLARSRGVHTVMVEPLEANLRILMRNLRANGWTEGIEVFPVALAKSPGLLDLYGSSTGASLLPGWAGASRAHVRTVPVTTVDAILGARWPSARMLIKIDVEGAELGVLQGAISTLARRPAPRWLVEVCLTENQTVVNPHFLEVFELFWSSGYHAETVEDRRTVQRADVESWIASGKRSFGSYNFLFLPR